MRTVKVDNSSGSIRFTCPVCGVPSICDIRYMSIQGHGKSTETYMLVCRACGNGSVWKQFNRKDNYNYELRLVDPILPDAPPPSSDMPEDVQIDYEEARLVSNSSPRASAAQ